MEKKQVFTVICPVYNEQQTVPLFFERIQRVFQELSPRYETRLIFVDNASTDKTGELIRQICREHKFVSYYVMSRNFGYQCSLECGLRKASGDIFGFVDVDCEDPPELFVEFLKHHEQGFDVVYGERKDREEGEFLKALRRFYYRLTRVAADDLFVLDMAEFSILNSAVREAILQDNNSFPFLRASIGRVGFRLKNIPYKRQRRVAGESHYNYWRMTVFGVAGILSSSTLPLRFVAYSFPFWVLGMLGLGVGGVFFENEQLYRAMVLLGFLFSGFAMMAVCIYLARVYKNGLNRPNYFLNEKFCIEQRPHTAPTSGISMGRVHLEDH